ncbi:MAG: four helix bundle protein [Ignavibacteriaceae bacterium]
MDSEDLKRRTKKFAHDCIKLSGLLPNIYLGNHIKGQLIRASTSVAANYRAVCLAQSKASFISKISIVIEEADETLFWLQVISDERLIDNDELRWLMTEANELVSIFIASRKTAQKKSSKD